jgi:ATP-binding cassette, subfamily B, bacterial
MQKKENLLIYLFKKSWLYSKGNRPKVVIFFVMFIMAQVIELLAGPFLQAKIIDIIQKEGLQSSNIYKIFYLQSLVIVITLTFWSIHGPARVMEQINAFKIKMNYRKFLLKGVMTLPMEWHADHHSGETIDKIEKGANGLASFSEESFMVVYGIVNLLVSYIVLAHFSKPSGAIVLVILLLSAWITLRFDKVLIVGYKELNKMENKVSEGVFDTVSNITTVIILRVEKLVFQALVTKINKPLELYRKNVTLSETKWFLTSLCSAIMTVLVMCTFYWQNVGEGILVSEIYLLANYLNQISDVFYRFTSMYSNTVKNRARVMNSEDLTTEFRVENFTNHVLPKSWNELRINGLNFSYNNGRENVLNLEDVKLSIKKGERIALIGESGSGKTTLLKIMRDLYHPLSLELSVDGIPIPHGFDGISRAISLVPQNPEIFATTILENITLGAEHDMSTVRKFTDMACFTDIALSLPNKFDSSVKEKGVNLSGGQQQRLALARGLLACDDKDIVLLDEPTSSLDVATEMSVYQNIFSAFDGKTVISSIHRLHLLPLFHQIYLFDGGKIVASGNLRELLATSPKFREMWQEYNKHSEVADQ